MQIDWLNKKDSKDVLRFLDFLKGLVPYDQRLTNPFQTSKWEILVWSILIPIIKAGLEEGEYRIPETMEFAELTQKVNLNAMEISINMLKLFNLMDATVTTAAFGKHHGFTPRQVRRLIERGLLEGKKVDGYWRLPAVLLSPWRLRVR